MLELSPREARRLAIGAQQLAGPAPKRPTRKRLRETIFRLGALQIDTIHVVARSHHIVLWSRLGNHPKEWLYELCYPERALFEYWAHAAAFVPVELFPYFRRMMLEYADPNGTRWNTRTLQWMDENAEILNHVIAHATEFGPVASTSFTAPEGSTRAEPWAWYGNKPTNVALELLWTMGTFMVHRREKFQRWYDLTERIMPDWDDAQLPDVDDERRVLAAHAFSAMGIATARWLPDYFRKNWGNSSIRNGTVQSVVQDLIERGLVVPARVRGWDDEAYVWAELLEKRIPLSRTTLLSPFDSLVWDRRRTATMFDFELMLEAYTPAPKRRYGYFSLPILYRDQLVGRLDPKADRATGLFYVRALHLEPWFVDRADDRFYASLAAALTDFAAFNDCNTVLVERSDPPGADMFLTAALAG